MSDASGWTSHRAVVAGAITAVAAGYGAYCLWTLPPAGGASSEGSLRRSNAVHRPNRDRPHHNLNNNRHTHSLNIEFPNLDLSAGEFDSTEVSDGNDEPTPSQGLRGLLFYIAEEEAKKKAYEHRGIHCDSCGDPIYNIRWHCLNCSDIDLCSTCEATTDHNRTHIFAKIKIPLPSLCQPVQLLEPWYPGIQDGNQESLLPEDRRRFSDLYNFKEPTIDAYFDQFTCIANVRLANDATRYGVAIDRNAFRQAMVSRRWAHKLGPNALIDRIFSFYDTDQNSLIDFDEFLSGMAYLRGSKRFHSLQRAIAGFDTDRDGYICRSDVVQLLRAKYEIQQLIIQDTIEDEERKTTRANIDTLRSGQPISSVFSDQDIPAGGIRPPRGKVLNAVGDMEPLPGVKAILDDDDVEAPPIPIRNLSTRTSLLEPWEEDADDPTARFERALRDPEDHPLSPTGLLPLLLDPDMDDVSLRTIEEYARGRRVPIENAAGSSDGVYFNHLTNADFFWRQAEAAFNEILNPLFETKEKQDRSLNDRRGERDRFRKQIDAYVEAFPRLYDPKKASDPLVAQAYGAAEMAYSIRLSAARASVSMPLSASSVGELVPTDTESLARREAAIAETPLSDLLKSSGYSIREQNDLPAGSQQENLAPTRAQSAAAPGRALPDSEARLGRGALAELAELDLDLAEIDKRGGIGRLSYSEIEEMASSLEGGAIKSLIKDWLEFASF